MADKKIDEAFVEVKPDVDGFARETNRELSTAFKQIERKLDDVIDTIEVSFHNLTVELQVLFSDLSHDMREALGDVGDRAGHVGRKIGADISAGANVAESSVDDLADDAVRDLRRIERQARDTGRTIATSMLAGSAGAGAITQLAGVGGVLRNLAAIPLSLGGSLLAVVKFSAIAALVPIIISLTGALLDLIPVALAVPAAFAVLIAAIAPIPIAFNGIGEAVKALMSGDLEKLDEALKKLTPSARAFVMEINAIRKPMSDLRKSVQEAFFGQLSGTLTKIGSFLLPVLRVGLTKIATALGVVTKMFGDMLTSNDILVSFRNILESTARFVAILGPALVDAFGTMFGMVEGGLPFIERLAFWLAELIRKWGEWQAKVMASGQFSGWIETAITTLKNLGTLTKSVFNFIIALAGDAGDEGRSFILVLAEMFDRMSAFFKSPEGQEFLQDTLDGLKAVGATLLLMVDALRLAGHASNEFFDGIARVSVSAILFWNWLKRLVSTVGELGTSLGNWVAGVGLRVVNFFMITIPAAIDRTVQFLTKIPSMLVDMAGQAFDRLFFMIGFGIGTMINNLMTLPSRIGALFTLVWNTAFEVTRFGIDRIIAWVMSLSGRLGAIVSAAWSVVTSLFRQGVDNVTNTVNTLPGRVWTAIKNAAARARDAAVSVASAAVDIGRGIIDGIINGIERGISRLVSTAARAARSALDGAKRALGIASPSKEWAKLGVQSVEGYTGAIDHQMSVSANDIQSAIRGPLDGMSTTNVTNSHAEVGARELTVILTLDGEVIARKIVRTMRDNPQEVAAAAETGTTKLARRR